MSNTSCEWVYQYTVGGYDIQVNRDRLLPVCVIKASFGENYRMECTLFGENDDVIEVELYNGSECIAQESFHLGNTIDLPLHDKVETLESIVLELIYKLEYEIHTEVENMEARAILQTMPTIYNKESAMYYVGYANRLYSIKPKAGAEINAQSNGANPYPV